MCFERETTRSCSKRACLSAGLCGQSRTGNTLPAALSRTSTATMRKARLMWRAWASRFTPAQEALPMTPELPIVRGWLMDEFERRDQKAFDAWSEDEDPDASPRKYFH